MTKVGIVLFSMNADSLGGVRNYIYYLGKGFDQIGVDYDIICVYKRKTKMDTDKWVSILLKNPRILLWSKPEDIKELNDYDFLITKHIGPHGTEKNPPAKGWEAVFTDTEPEKFPAIGDPYWRQYYPWSVNVRDHVAGIIAEHEPALRALMSYPADKALIRLPYDTNEFRPYDYNKKERIIVSFTHWKPWKNHRYLLEALATWHDDILSVIKEIRLFSDGLERRKMKSPYSEIRDMYGYGDVWQRAEPYFTDGYIVPEETKQQELERAMFTTDLSWSKNWNNNITYVCFESYAYGCIMIGSSEHFNFTIDAYIDTGYPREPRNIYNAIMKTKDIDEDKYNNMIMNGREFIKEYHDAKLIAKQTLYYMENKDTDGSFEIFKNRSLFTY